MPFSLAPLEGNIVSISRDSRYLLAVKFGMSLKTTAVLMLISASMLFQKSDSRRVINPIWEMKQSGDVAYATPIPLPSSFHDYPKSKAYKVGIVGTDGRIFNLTLTLRQNGNPLFIDRIQLNYRGIKDKDLDTPFQTVFGLALIQCFDVGLPIKRTGNQINDDPGLWILNTIPKAVDSGNATYFQKIGRMTTKIEVVTRGRFSILMTIETDEKPNSKNWLFFCRI
jgi:hypothetical protein